MMIVYGYKQLLSLSEQDLQKVKLVYLAHNYDIKEIDQLCEILAKTKQLEYLDLTDVLTSAQEIVKIIKCLRVNYHNDHKLKFINFRGTYRIIEYSFLDGTNALSAQAEEIAETYVITGIDNPQYKFNLAARIQEEPCSWRFSTDWYNAELFLIAQISLYIYKNNPLIRKIHRHRAYPFKEPQERNSITSHIAYRHLCKLSSYDYASQLPCSAMIVDRNRVLLLPRLSALPLKARTHANGAKELRFKVGLLIENEMIKVQFVKTVLHNGHDDSQRHEAHGLYMNNRNFLSFSRDYPVNEQASAGSTDTLSLRHKDYIATDWVPGIDGHTELGEAMGQLSHYNTGFTGRFRDTRIKLALSQLLAILCCHAQGIVHCDIKHPNFMVTDGLASLIDFGSCFASTSNKEVHISKIICTDGFRPPELQNNNLFVRISPKLDYFSAGITLREVLVPKKLYFSHDGNWYFRTSSRTEDKDSAIKYGLEAHFNAHLQNEYGIAVTNAVEMLCHENPNYRGSVGNAFVAIAMEYQNIALQVLNAHLHSKLLPQLREKIHKFPAAQEPLQAMFLQAAELSVETREDIIHFVNYIFKLQVVIFYTQIYAFSAGAGAVFENLLQELAGIDDRAPYLWHNKYYTHLPSQQILDHSTAVFSTKKHHGVSA